jgi:tetratricopeptide (TPR) repeat protein
MIQSRFGTVLLLLRLLAGAAPVSRNNDVLTQALARLKLAKDRTEVDRLDTTIWRIWCGAGSRRAVGDLAQALQAMAINDFATAREFLDRAIAADPSFAEAWNRRAMVNFLTCEADKAVSDIERVLVLEPRHYGALAGLGQVLLQEGETKHALLAFEAALAVNPHLTQLRQTAERLRLLGSNREPPKPILT